MNFPPALKPNVVSAEFINMWNCDVDLFF